jgi:hypothetical protein
MNKGTRVTRQPKQYYDGQPVANWPYPEFVGTITKVDGAVAKVKWDSGRSEWQGLSKLIELGK